MHQVKMDSPEEYENYKKELDQAFVRFFTKKLQEAVGQEGKHNFPMKLEYFRHILCSCFPISASTSSVTHAESNEWFMSGKQLCEFLDMTIRNDKEMIYSD